MPFISILLFLNPHNSLPLRFCFATTNTTPLSQPNPIPHMKVSMCVDEQWKKSALTDDAMVAELLLQLHAPPPPPSKPALPIEWKVRQRRSKTLTVNAGAKTLPRASPTTPLSWSGGTSVSCNNAADAAAGSEESSHVHHLPTKTSQTSRSKVTTEETTTGKRPRKKKTLVELKAAELALEEERKELIKEVKRARANLDRERSTHENLKRLKLELESQTGNRVGGPSSLNQEAKSFQITTFASSESGTHAASMPQIDSINTFPKQCIPFAIPDLNLPLEDDCNIEVQCEAS